MTSPCSGLKGFPVAIACPGLIFGMRAVARIVAVRSQPLPRKVFRIFNELKAMYRNLVEQLVVHTIENDVRSFVKLKASRCHYLREFYPSLPSPMLTQRARTP